MFTASRNNNVKAGTVSCDSSVNITAPSDNNGPSNPSLADAAYSKNNASITKKILLK